MNAYRALPGIDTLLSHPSLAAFPLPLRTRAARQAVEEARGKIAEGGENDFDGIIARTLELASAFEQPTLSRAINASGVILHTGLGRARLADSVVKHVAALAGSHVSLEWDMEENARGDRQEHVASLLCHLTGAQRAMVVNNAAGALVLVLTALAKGREVVLSRGQMVEIGGSFRVPEIVEQSGCVLREVGCTNRTRASDYADALSEDAAVLLRCSASNFRMTGFVGQPSLPELCGLAREAGIWLVDDMGSGCVVDTRRYGLPREQTMADSVREGADAVVASGDKLLGGPQAGILLLTEDTYARIVGHPLARALRVDKLTLAALEATLRLYSEGREEEIPTLRYLSRRVDQLKRVAGRLARAYTGLSRVVASVTEVGGGSAPGNGLPTFCAVLLAESCEELARRLRVGDPPILGRIRDGAVWLDPRTVDREEIVLMERALRKIDPC